MLVDPSLAFTQRQLGAPSPTSAPGPVGSAVLPVLPAVSALLPSGGLRRGTTVEIRTSPTGPGRSTGQPAVLATSLLLVLLAGPSRARSWCAVVGVPDLGLVAASEAGIELTRLALVPAPAEDWAPVVAALLDGCDVVGVRPPAVASAQARRLSARARQRGAVLVCLGSWPGAEVRLAVTARRWEGVGGDGSGHLRARHVVVRVEGRGAATRPREAALRLPAPSGAPVEATNDVPIDAQVADPQQAAG